MLRALATCEEASARHAVAGAGAGAAAGAAAGVTCSSSPEALDSSPPVSIGVDGRHDDGASADDIEALVESLVARTHVFGSLDTLDNLKKGGRIGGAQALIGSMLSIKPLIDISTGEVQEAGKQRTRKKSMIWLRDKLAEFGEIENLAIMHGEAPDIDDFVALIGEVADVSNARTEVIGPVVGTHGGPRVVGYAFTVPE